MATFATTYTSLLRKINRPATETDILAECKDAINAAVLQLQRDHAFAYTEALATFEYAANALYVDVGTVCNGLIRDYISLQQIAVGGTYEGKPIKIKSYSQIQTDRINHYRKHSIDDTQIFAETSPGLTIEDGYREDRFGWVMGRNIGIYPRPTQATTYLIHFHSWLPALVADGDTNFFLDYAQDLVQMLALKRLHIVMGVDSRFAVSQEEVNASILNLHTWDSQVKENPNTSIE